MRTSPGGLFRTMMITHRLNGDIRQFMGAQVEGAQFRVIDTQELALDLDEVRLRFLDFELGALKILREGGGHDNFADIVEQAGDVIGFIWRRTGPRRGFRGS